MLFYLIKRLLLAGLTLSVILLASYVLLRCAPGDPARSNMFVDEGTGTSMDAVFVSIPSFAVPPAPGTPWV